MLGLTKEYKGKEGKKNTKQNKMKEWRTKSSIVNSFEMEVLLILDKKSFKLVQLWGPEPIIKG